MKWDLTYPVETQSRDQNDSKIQKTDWKITSRNTFEMGRSSPFGSAEDLNNP